MFSDDSPNMTMMEDPMMMLLSKDAIADVLEVAKGHDFYRPAHETIFDAITDLYAAPGERHAHARCTCTPPMFVNDIHNKSATTPRSSTTPSTARRRRSTRSPRGGDPHDR